MKQQKEDMSHWKSKRIPSVPLQISEKQRTLYEALERQQKYQDTLQSISTKMETTEIKLNESLEPAKSPESQMAEHQVTTCNGTAYLPGLAAVVQKQWAFFSLRSLLKNGNRS